MNVYNKDLVCVVREPHTLALRWKKELTVLWKPKSVTTQMKALDEYILMVLFVLLLKRVHFLANET